MRGAEDFEPLIRRAARSGAASVTGSRQLVADALQWTLDRWQDALIAGKEIPDPGAWAYKVAQNAAKRIGGKGRPVCLPADVAAADLDAVTLSDCDRDSLRATLVSKMEFLRGAQARVLIKMCESSMSFHRAAKELGMKRWSVQRSFRSALRRLERESRRAQTEAPPFLKGEEPNRRSHASKHTARRYINRRRFADGGWEQPQRESPHAEGTADMHGHVRRDSNGARPPTGQLRPEHAVVPSRLGQLNVGPMR